jgi:hypothetical protein
VSRPQCLCKAEAEQTRASRPGSNRICRRASTTHVARRIDGRKRAGLLQALPTRRDAFEAFVVEQDDHPSLRIDQTVCSERAELATDHFADGANGVREALMADVYDGASVRCRQREFTQVPGDTRTHRLRDIVHGRPHRLSRPRRDVLCDEPRKRRILRCSGSNLLDSQQLNGRLDDRLGVPVVSATKRGPEADQIARPCIADCHLTAGVSRDEHANEAGSDDRYRWGVSGTKNAVARTDMGSFAITSQKVVPCNAFQ